MRRAQTPPPGRNTASAYRRGQASPHPGRVCSSTAENNGPVSHPPRERRAGIAPAKRHLPLPHDRIHKPPFPGRGSTQARDRNSGPYRKAPASSHSACDNLHCRSLPTVCLRCSPAPSHPPWPYSRTAASSGIPYSLLIRRPTERLLPRNTNNESRRHCRAPAARRTVYRYTES